MKNDDPLLTRLGEVLRGRREREDAPTLDARSDSGPPPNSTGAPGDESLRSEVFAPFSERLRTGIVERALEGVAQQSAAPTGPNSRVTPANANAPGVTPLVRPKRRRLPASTVGALAVLAAAGWLLWPGPMLPPYTLTVEGGDRAVRGSLAEPQGGGQPVVITSGSQLDLVLRPANPIADPLEARLYVVASPGTPPIAASRAAEVAVGGSIRWRGTARELFGDRTGEVELLLVVSQPSSSPDAATLASGTDRGRGWQSFRQRVHVINER